MNKYVKLLVESFFDDLEDDLNDDSFDSVSTLLNDIIMKTSNLSDCTTKDNIIKYFEINYNFEQYFKSMITHIEQLLNSYENNRERLKYLRDGGMSYRLMSITNNPSICKVFNKSKTNSLSISFNFICDNRQYYILCDNVKMYTVSKTNKVTFTGDISLLIELLVPIDNILLNNKHIPHAYEMSDNDLTQCKKILLRQNNQKYKTRIIYIPEKFNNAQEQLTIIYAGLILLILPDIKYTDNLLLDFSYNCVINMDNDSSISLKNLYNLTQIYLKDIFATIEKYKSEN